MPIIELLLQKKKKITKKNLKMRPFSVNFLTLFSNTAEPISRNSYKEKEKKNKKILINGRSKII